MSQQIDQQVFAFARQFADNAFKAQAVVLKGLEQAAGLQLGALEQQSRSVVDFVTAAAELRDAEGVRNLWDKGVALGRAQTEQTVALTQSLVAVSRQTAESLGALAQAQPAANDAVTATAGRKPAAK